MVYFIPPIALCTRLRMIVLRMRQLLQRGGDAVSDAPLAPPLLLLHHRGQQWGVQEEEEGGEDMESSVANI